MALLAHLSDDAISTISEFEDCVDRLLPSLGLSSVPPFLKSSLSAFWKSALTSTSLPPPFKGAKNSILAMLAVLHSPTSLFSNQSEFLAFIAKNLHLDSVDLISMVNSLLPLLFNNSNSNQLLSAYLAQKNSQPKKDHFSIDCTNAHIGFLALALLFPSPDFSISFSLSDDKLGSLDESISSALGPFSSTSDSESDTLINVSLHDIVLNYSTFYNLFATIWSIDPSSVLFHFPKDIESSLVSSPTSTPSTTTTSSTPTTPTSSKSKKSKSTPAVQCQGITKSKNEQCSRAGPVTNSADGKHYCKQHAKGLGIPC